MDQVELDRILADLPLGAGYYFPRLGSTSDRAVELLNSGAADLTLVVAGEQTSGRGRGNRSWFSPPGSGLYFSLVLVPGPAEHGPVYSRLAGYSAMGALAVCETLEQEFGLKAEIKWPNDVLVDKKKVCGILAEAKWQGDRLQAVVLGAGVNLNRHEIPESARLDYPAGSIEESIIHSLKREAGQMLPVRRSELLHAILLNLLNWRDLIGGPAMITAWESRLAYRGEQVVILHPETGAVVHLGRLDGLNADGSLRLLNSENKPVAVVWGDLSLRLIDTI